MVAVRNPDMTCFQPPDVVVLTPVVCTWYNMVRYGDDSVPSCGHRLTELSDDDNSKSELILVSPFFLQPVERCLSCVSFCPRFRMRWAALVVGDVSPPSAPFCTPLYFVVYSYDMSTTYVHEVYTGLPTHVPTLIPSNLSPKTCAQRGYPYAALVVVHSSTYQHLPNIWFQ